MTAGAQTANNSEAVDVLNAVSAWPLTTRRFRGLSRNVIRCAGPGLPGPRCPFCRCSAEPFWMADPTQMRQLCAREPTADVPHRGMTGRQHRSSIWDVVDGAAGGWATN